MCATPTQMAAGLLSALASLAFLAFFSFLALGVGSRPLSAGAAAPSCLYGHEAPFLHVPLLKYLHGASFLLVGGLVERPFPLPLGEGFRA